MVLNIFPRRKEPETSAPAAQSQTESHPEPSPEALDDEPRKRTRRGTRGGKGRSRTGTQDATAIENDETTEAVLAALPAEDTAPVTDAAAPEAEAEAEPAPAPRRRAPRRTAAAAKAEADAAEAVTEPAPEADPEAAPAPAPRARRPRAEKAPATEAKATPEPRTRPEPSENGTSSAAILRAIEKQNRQMEQLLHVQEDISRKLAAGGGGGASTARPPRVGVFVDAANIELACDRLRARFDWGKVLHMITEGRELVRAMAYSPVHDDLNVSMETQRFAEPFLDKGFKVVTKPLKRFADGTVKANVDIEIALDVVSMLDRVDVVCLVSGDGDFQPLVEFVQRRGVRCEVVAVGASTANNLRHAADGYIDLQHRLRDIRA